MIITFVIVIFIIISSFHFTYTQLFRSFNFQFEEVLFRQGDNPLGLLNGLRAVIQTSGMVYAVSEFVSVEGGERFCNLWVSKVNGENDE